MDERARALKVLKWYAPAERVILDRDKLHEIIGLIRKFPDELVTVGYDPARGS